MDDETVLAAIAAFGGRVRGEPSPADTPELAARLQGAWAAEGHPPVRPGSATTPPGHPAARVAHRLLRLLPVQHRARIRRILDRVRAR